MGPIASPDEALGGELDVSAREATPIGVGRRPDLGEDIRAGELHPRAVFLDEVGDHAKCGMFGPGRLWQVAHVIEHDWHGHFVNKLSSSTILSPSDTS